MFIIICGDPEYEEREREMKLNTENELVIGK